MKRYFLFSLTILLLLNTSKVRAQAHTWQWIHILSINDTVCYDPEHPPKINYEVSHGWPFGPDLDGNTWFGHGYTASSPQAGWLHASYNGLIYASISSQTGLWTGSGYTRVIFGEPEPSFPVQMDFQLNTICVPNLVTSEHVAFGIHGIKIETSSAEPDTNLCFGETYSLNYTISGYPPPYSILIEKSTTVNGGWAPMNNFTTMSASGTYTVGTSNYAPGSNYYRMTVTSTSSSCSRKSSVLALRVSKAQASTSDFRACLNQEPVPLDIGVTGGIGTCTYNWSPATNLSSTTIANPAYTPASSGPHWYTVVVTDQMGCQASQQILVVTAASTFMHPLAVATPNPVCQGGTVNLTGVFGGGVLPISYTWTNSLSTVLNPSGAQSISQVITTPQTYTLKLRDFYNCTASDDIAVTIDPLLGPQIAPMTIAPVCPGKEVTITPVVTSSAAIASREWNPGGNNTPSITDNAHTTATYSYTVTDVNNCFRSASYTIPRNPALSGSISLSVQQSPVCYNSVVPIQATITGGTPPFSSGSNPYSITTTTPQVYTSVTDAQGCFSEANLTVSYPSRIIVTRDHPTNPNEPDVDWYSGPDFIPYATYKDLCAGDLLDFGEHYTSRNGAVSGGVPPYTYNWYGVFNYKTSTSPWEITAFDLNSTSFPDFQFQTYTDNNMYSFLPPDSRLKWVFLFVDITDANGCVIDHTGTIPDETIDHGYMLMQMPIGAGDYALDFNFEQDICNLKQEGCFFFDPERLSNLNDDGYVINITSFKSGNKTTIKNSEHRVCTTFADRGYHLVTVTGTSTCGEVSFSKIIYIADIENELQEYISICDPQDHNLYAQSYIESDQVCGASIAMPEDGTDIEFIAGLYIDLNPGFVSEVQPDFTARIDRCLQDMPVKKSFTEQTALDESESGFKISILPNPTNGMFEVAIPESDFVKNKTKIEVYDVTGRLVYSNTASGSKSTVNISNLHNGIYIVKVFSGSKTTVQKILYR